MSKIVFATFVAAGLLAAAPMLPATGFQSLQTFTDVRVTIPAGTGGAGAAALFCKQRGHSGAGAFELKQIFDATETMEGTALFNTITCRSFTPVATNGGLLPRQS